MTKEQKLPLYKSHKQVRAAKIGAMEINERDGTLTIYPVEANIRPFTVPRAYLLRHMPHEGGYFVQYDDGYQSFSPAASFEKGNTLVAQAEAPTEAELSAVAQAPRVTPPELQAEIASEHYFTAENGVTGASPYYQGEQAPDALGLLTFCVLVLKNGYTVTGESACASPANFNADFGRRFAREKAIEKLWPLLGFRLRDQLAASEQANAAPAAHA